MKNICFRTAALLAVCMLFSSCAAGDEGPARQAPAEPSLPEPASQMQPEPQPDLPAVDIPEMTAEQRRYCDEYIDKLLFNGMLALNWSQEDYRDISTAPDGRNLSNNLMMAFEDLSGQEAMQGIWQEHGGDIPAAVVEEVLLKHFPFSVEQLHEILASSYDPVADRYSYEGGRGGGPIEAVVTDVEEDREFVRLAYDLYAGDPPVQYSGVLTLKEVQGEFVYWSVVTEGDVEPSFRRDVALRE